jgi:hypothetical protein
MNERTRVVTLEELAKTAGGEQRVSKEHVGLYEITRTSRAITPEMLPVPSPGENVVITDDPLPRLRRWLEEIYAGILAIGADLQNYPEAVQANAKRCQLAATQLSIFMRAVGEATTHSAQFVAGVAEAAAELADEWHTLKVNAGLQRDVDAHRASAGAGRANRAEQNAQRRSRADAAAVQAFENWCLSPSRQSQLSKLSATQRLQKYLKVARPPERQGKRLRAMLKDGRIK